MYDYQAYQVCRPVCENSAREIGEYLARARSIKNEAEFREAQLDPEDLMVGRLPHGLVCNTSLSLEFFLMVKI
jgi:hypothetical protein